MKLITLNIEDDNHLDKIIPFIGSELPDVLCLQEVFERDIPRFTVLGYTCEFRPIASRSLQDTSTAIGVALLARHTMSNIRDYYYRGSFEETRDDLTLRTALTVPPVVLVADVLVNDQIFTIGTTHFTWTPKGDEAAQEQIVDMKKLLTYTESIGPHVICGDFNIPRHQNPLYNNIVEHYVDNIPASYTSSLDKVFHKRGADPALKELFTLYMVDYIFTKPPYHATNVRLQFGLSDHAGVIATITKDGH